MAFYESIFIARQELGDKELENTIDNFKKILESNNANLVDTESWGLRNLAYKIEKNKKGHYMVLKIDGNGDAIQELERNMRIDENIIRYLSLKTESINNDPSILAKKNVEN
ncbi:MAG: 30S ribosomal protein S6 [Alphaproteobacteria bacterium]|nr:30S ribosomal protein S6 [Alphaproteobacteria bacterium]